MHAHTNPPTHLLQASHTPPHMHVGIRSYSWPATATIINPTKNKLKVKTTRLQHKIKYAVRMAAYNRTTFFILFIYLIHHFEQCTYKIEANYGQSHADLFLHQGAGRTVEGN